MPLNEKMRDEDLVMSWQPIETAPRDGTRILLSNENRVGIGQWITNFQSGYNYNDWFSLMLNKFPYNPTHWMFLPEPPK